MWNLGAIFLAASLGLPEGAEPPPKAFADVDRLETFECQFRTHTTSHHPGEPVQIRTYVGTYRFSSSGLFLFEYSELDEQGRPWPGSTCVFGRLDENYVAVQRDAIGRTTELKAGAVEHGWSIGIGPFMPGWQRRFHTGFGAVTSQEIDVRNTGTAVRLESQNGWQTAEYVLAGDGVVTQVTLSEQIGSMRTFRNLVNYRPPSIPGRNVGLGGDHKQFDSAGLVRFHSLCEIDPASIRINHPIAESEFTRQIPVQARTTSGIHFTDRRLDLWFTSTTVIGIVACGVICFLLWLDVRRRTRSNTPAGPSPKSA